MNKIIDLIKFDRQIRYDKKYSDDIFRLQDLDKTNEWDFSLPTLVREMDVFNMAKKKISNLNKLSFKNTFYKYYPDLQNIQWDNVLVAGGCIGDCVMNINNNNDIDIFIIADDDDKASEVVKNIIKSIVLYKKKHYAIMRSKNLSKVVSIESVDESDLNMIFTRNKYTLNIDNYQIIFRRYSSKSEVLHGFDIGSSAIGFDGEDIYFTSLSKFVYETGCNIIDTTRRSTSYEFRLQKYLDRGFNIIMPEFDYAKLDTRLYETYGIQNVCELPFLCFTYNEVNNNKIKYTKFYKKKGDVVINSDYGDGYGDVNEYVLFYKNLYNILSGKADNLIYMSFTSDKILNTEISLMAHKIDYFYDELYKKITSDQFPVGMIKRYITVKSANEVFVARNDKVALNAIFTKQREYIVNLISTCKFSNEIAWISTNPGTQLTSSFNPIIEDASKWYGDYYISRF